ncbi:UTP--glucose-1-phosphate uridylyltransferase [bacterium]|nr:UTP--glucose-1-phosphate uridylyltransferase [bacterium]
MQKIRKAILPVAGLGTRFLPATKAQPKEMLPIVDKPIVQYLVEEAAASGIEEIIFVTGRGKRAIEDHFDISYELLMTLHEKNKHDFVPQVKDIPNLAQFTYVRQKTARGDGDAIWHARHLVGDEPVLIMFGDALYDSKVPTAKQLMEAYEEHHAPIVGLARIPREEVSKFGVVAGNVLGEKDWKIEKFIEKPKIEDAPSDMVAVGKYIITPEVFETLEKIIGRNMEEIRLSDVFDDMLSRSRPLFGRVLDGEWLDTGDKFNFLKATIHMGLKHPEVGEKLRKYLKGLQLE